VESIAREPQKGGARGYGLASCSRAEKHPACSRQTTEVEAKIICAHSSKQERNDEHDRLHDSSFSFATRQAGAILRRLWEPYHEARVVQEIAEDAGRNRLQLSEASRTADDAAAKVGNGIGGSSG